MTYLRRLHRQHHNGGEGRQIRVKPAIVVDQPQHHGQLFQDFHPAFSCLAGWNRAAVLPTPSRTPRLLMATSLRGFADAILWRVPRIGGLA